MMSYLAGRPGFRYHRFESAGGSSSGRTLDSGSRYEGSNPSPPAIFFLATLSGPVDLPAVEILYNVRLSQNAWRIRLARFRTPPSQGGNRGSNPLCATTPHECNKGTGSLLRIHPPTRSNSRYATRCLSLCCTNSPLYRIGDLNQRGRRLRLAGRVSSRKTNMGVSSKTAGLAMRGGKLPPLIRSGTLIRKPAPIGTKLRVKRRFISPMRHHTCQKRDPFQQSLPMSSNSRKEKRILSH